MKVLAIAATSSKQSINRALVTHASNALKADYFPGAEVEVLDLNDYEMPIYSVDREIEGGIPEAAHRFFEKITNSDALLISFAEHNGHYTAAYKNIFDWASRIDMKVYQDKPMVVMAASVGPGGAATVLKAANDSAPFFGANIKGSVSVGPFGEKFDAEKGVLTDATLAMTLRESLKALA